MPAGIGYKKNKMKKPKIKGIQLGKVKKKKRK